MKEKKLRSKKGIRFVPKKISSGRVFSSGKIGEHTDTYMRLEKEKQLKLLLGNEADQYLLGAQENEELVETQGEDFAVSEKVLKKETSDGGKILSDSIVKQKLDEVAEKSIPTQKKKSNFWSLVFLAVNVFVVVMLAKTLLADAGDASLSTLIEVQGGRLVYLVVALVLFLFLYFFDSLFISVMLKTSTGKFRPFLSYRTSVIGKYYEAITPLSAGGQPAQVVYMAKRGVSAGVATSIPIVRATILNLVNILVALVMFIFVVPSVQAPNDLLGILFGLLKILSYIGLVFNTLYLLVMLIVANSKVFGRVLVRGIVKFGYRLRLVKSYRNSYKKFMGQVAEFQNSISYVKRNWWMLLSTVLIMLLEIMAYASMPFVVSVALSDITFASWAELGSFWIETVALYYICFMASAYIPLPGGTGMMEFSFIILFTPIIGVRFVVYAFLIWRIVSYYLTIAQGFALTIGDIVGSYVKKQRRT